jgi:hypothetical protein
MPLSPIQKGAIGQFAFLITALVTGKGQVEIYVPSPDDEGRDAEVRRHLKPENSIGIQIKVALAALKTDRGDVLSITFHLKLAKIQNDPRLWYFFAVFDPAQLRFRDPVFLIRADIFHRMAREKKVFRNQALFEIEASLEPHAHDRWTRHRVALHDLGSRLLEIIDTEAIMTGDTAQALPDEAILVGRPQKQTARRRVRRAA